MITIFKWSIVDAAEMSETLFQNDAEIEALEREKAQLAKTIDARNKEAAELRTRIAELETENADLDKEIKAMQKATITPLPGNGTPEKKTPGRKKATAAVTK